MKKIILLIALSIYGQYNFAQHFMPTNEGSLIKFSIKNFGVSVSRSFKGVKGKMYFNQANILSSSFNVSVDAATINTSNSLRGGHLKKGEYFDV